MTGQNWKNEREQLREEVKQKREQLREENKQKREEIKNHRSGSGVTQTGTTLTTEQLTCVRTAVAKRETGILSAFTTLSATTNSGYITRAAALNTAWTLSGRTERKMAIDTAWRTWKDVMKVARDTYKTSHKAALSAFRVEAQTCKVPEALADADKESSEIKIGGN